MTSRNLLDVAAHDPLMKRVTQAGNEITTATLPRLWCVASLVGELGIGKTKLSDMLRTVPPDFVDGRTRYWHLPKVLERLSAAELRHLTQVAEGDKLDPHQERARRDRAAAREAELRIEEREGGLLPLDEVEAQDAAHIHAVRGALGVIGATVAARVAVLDDPRECQRVIDDEVWTILAGIAETLERAGSRLEAPGETDDPDLDRALPGPARH